MRLFITLILVTVSLATQLEAAKLQDSQPNVILIMTDDQGYGDLSITGNEIIETPNMDRIGKEGAWLKQFYVSPVCTPTRAHLMTGRYNYRTRAIDTYRGRAVMEPEEVTLAETLSASGYATGIFGKWHLGDSYPTRAMDQGFDESIVHQGGGLRQPANPPEGERYHDPILFHNGKPKRFEGFCTDIYFDEALKFIEKNTKAKKPFFAYIPTNAPHGPFDEPPTRDMKEHYQAKLPNDKTPTRAVFYSMIKNIDQNIGRLLDRVEKLDIDRNTIIIFLTDNGPAGGGSAGPFRAAKGSVYQGGIRTVCFVRWKDTIKAGATSDATTAHLDLMPTILDACKVKPPQDVKLDGRSFFPLIVNKKEIDWPDRHLFFQWHRGDVPKLYHHFAAVDPQGKWKLLNSGKAGLKEPVKPIKFELYDLHNDIGEKNDLADKHPEIVSRLKKEYENWFADVSNTRNPNFGMPPIVIGSEHQKTVILTPQDKRVDKNAGSGWWATGYWPVDIRKPGPYTINVLLTQETAKETFVNLTVTAGDKTLIKKISIPRGVKSMAVGNVSLPAPGLGKVIARVETENKNSPRVFQVTIK